MKKSKVFTGIVAMLLLVSFQTSSVKTVKIGSQVWMADNLNVSKFINGDPILYVNTDEGWEKAGLEKKPAWCYYYDVVSSGKFDGKLYNWYAVNDARGLAPAGWHIPNDQEWAKLIGYSGGENNAGLKMKGTTRWMEKGHGNNSSGFDGMPGGSREEDGQFEIVVNGYGTWWSSTENNTYHLPEANAISLHFYDSTASIRDHKKAEGNSVRCIKD